MEGGELRGEGPFSCPTCVVLLVMAGLVASSSGNRAAAVFVSLGVSEGVSPLVWDPACSLPTPAATEISLQLQRLIKHDTVAIATHNEAGLRQTYH